LIGDIHGAVYDYKAYAIDKFEGPTIQIGDFGIGFGQGDYWLESVSEFHKLGGHRFIRGNHDHPALCKTMPSCISDGSVENDVMFIGGAWSIDNPNAPDGWYQRTENYDWWADEECTDEEFERMMDVYNTVKPRVMITHDCPHKIAGHMFWDTGFLKGPRYPTRTGDFLQKMLDIHQPDFHFFGHWHHSMAYKYGNTTFVCLGILDTIDVDLSDSEQMYEAIYEKF
jgi:hypothetical protein